MKDKYLFRENAGDQYVGRCASCLDMLAKEFAVSPAYFDYSHFDSEKRYTMERRVRSFFEERLPSFHEYDANACNIASICFAQICFHYDFLLTNLHQTNPLCSSSMFRDIPSDIRVLARIAYPWDLTNNTPYFTGIPPHVTHMAEMEALKVEVANLRTTIVAEVGAAMDQRGFASKEHNTLKILDAMDTHFNKMADMAAHSLQLSCRSRNVSGHTFTMVNEDKDDDEDEDEDCSDAIVAEPDDGLGSAIVHARRTKSNALSSTLVKKREFLIGYHHNRLNVLPSNFVFPKMTPLQLITNWLVGDVSSNIPPYWTLASNNVVHFKGCVALRCMQLFMKTIEVHGRELNLWISSKNGWSYKSIGLLWEGVDCLLKNKYDHIRSNSSKSYVRRKREKQWKSYYNDIVKHRKAAAADAD